MVKTDEPKTRNHKRLQVFSMISIWNTKVKAMNNSVEEYLEKIRPYLRDMIQDLRTSHE